MLNSTAHRVTSASADCPTFLLGSQVNPMAHRVTTASSTMAVWGAFAQPPDRWMTSAIYPAVTAARTICSQTFSSTSRGSRQTTTSAMQKAKP